MAMRLHFHVVAKVDDVRDLPAELLAGMRQDALTNIREAQRLIVRMWRLTLSRVSPEPAAKGEPPRWVTGDLAGRVKAGRAAWANVAKTVMRGAIENDHPGAGALEWGAPDSGIAPHPHYRPTIRIIARDLEGVMTMGGEHWRER